MDLRSAVHATLEYSRFFDFPLTPQEIHHWLVCPKKVSFEELAPYFPKRKYSKDSLLRQKVDRITRSKTKLASRLIKILRFVPGLRMVALTGSVAAGNARLHDDIDLFFITAPHSLWIVRPVVILLISIFFRRRHPGEDHAHAKDAFCPNLWMDTCCIVVPVEKRSLYTAHEVLQIVPLLDRDNTYHHFIHHNRWVKKYLANAFEIKHHKPQNQPSKGVSSLFIPINYLFYLLQLLYMHPKKSLEYVNLHSAYLHTTDYTSRIDEHLNRG